MCDDTIAGRGRCSGQASGLNERSEQPRGREKIAQADTAETNKGVTTVQHDRIYQYQLKTQKVAWALRQQMGYPLFAPTNDATAFAGGGIANFAKGMEIAGLASQMRRDVVYLGWREVSDAEPTTFCVALRQMFQVDWIDGLLPFAATDTAPIILVSTRRDAFIGVGPRGLLELCPGKPTGLRAGKMRALKRIHRAAATMDDTLAENTVWLPRGAEWREPPANSGETVVRFN